MIQTGNYPLLMPEDKWCADKDFDKNQIEEIVLANSFPPSVCPESERSWDISEKQDGSITAHLLNGSKKIVIAGNGSGKILANTSIRKMFANFTVLERISGLGEVFDTRHVTDMSYVFYHCISLQKLDLSKWDVSAVTNFRGMFCCGYNQIGNAKLKRLNITGWNMSNATDLAYMFYGCGRLGKVDVKDWDVSHVTNFRHTFADCFRLKKLDVKKWDTHSVITFDGIFNDCRKLKEIDISNWDTSSCREFDQMFDHCTALRKIHGLSRIDTRNGISFEEMFFGCRKIHNLNLHSVNTDRVDGSEFTAYASSIKSKSTIKNMITGCNELKEITLSPSLRQSLCTSVSSLLLDKIKEAGYIVVSPKTGSMLPFLRPAEDQAAFYESNQFSKGDIVLFRSGYSSSLVMHRIHRVLSGGYLIKGDRDRHAEFVPEKNVYAYAKQIYRSGKAIEKNSLLFCILSLYSIVYNSLYASYQGSNHIFWKVSRRIRRKLFRKRVNGGKQ